MGCIYIRGERIDVSNDRPIDLILPEWNIIIKDTVIGHGVWIWSNLNIYGAEIGDDSSIATFVEIGKNVEIGSNTKIQSCVFIPEGVKIGNCVFIGPNVSFTNDVYPRACDERGKRKLKFEVIQTMVEDGASIGAGSVIRCGVRIGKKAMIGIGSIITEDVGDGEIFYGTKASKKGSIV
ncbi:hypothetical protein JZK55_09970 [Dissulfurispira thermophila]|uniref:N-acetyltransferase n=1 Tax=Dissulfurispira thermophila TaxID=2715679 RepID=A0A7G1GZY8_9BACT|nr:acyltransferase [Dissulfurispira thermophila]BCB96075.1 hypothetical protein JZK55_09970 [Dissulfurispira thermophila]